MRGTQIFLFVSFFFSLFIQTQLPKTAEQEEERELPFPLPRFLPLQREQIPPLPAPLPRAKVPAFVGPLARVALNDP